MMENNLFIWRFYFILIVTSKLINFYYKHNKFLFVLLPVIMLFL